MSDYDDTTITIPRASLEELLAEVTALQAALSRLSPKLLGELELGPALSGAAGFSRRQGVTE
jgi:hypothetical protein